MEKYPAELSEEIKDGRKELRLEQMIPAWGSVEIRFQYRLATPPSASTATPSPGAPAAITEPVPTPEEWRVTLKAWPGGVYSVGGREVDYYRLLGELNNLAFQQAKNHRVIQVTIDQAKGLDKSAARPIIEACEAFGLNSPENLAGKFALPESTIKNPHFQIRLVAGANEHDSETVKSESGTEDVRLEKKVFLDEGDVAYAWQEWLSDGKPCIVVRLTINGMRKFAALTDASHDRRIAILFNGRVIASPVIKATISGSDFSLSQKLHEGDAPALLELLNARLPVSEKGTAPRPTP